MIILPAIDLYDGKAVRLYKGDYQQMTVYNDHPVNVAADFRAKGADYVHVVDLEGAKFGTTPNIRVVADIKKQSGLFCEIGGGIRSEDTICRYLDLGIDRVILGTIAIENTDFLATMVSRYGSRIAVGADIKDGYIAIKGWVEQSLVTVDSFFATLDSIGVDNVICTDISKDGAMQGANHDLYRDLSAKYKVRITASGGVSSLDDVIRLSKLNIYGAIIGKAYYTGALDLKQAIEVVQ